MHVPGLILVARSVVWQRPARIVHVAQCCVCGAGVAHLRPICSTGVDACLHGAAWVAWLAQHVATVWPRFSIAACVQCVAIGLPVLVMRSVWRVRIQRYSCCI